VDDTNAIAKGEFLRGAEERSDVVSSGQTALGEERSSGSAGAEDGDVH
jgi:hypothetical protein